MPGEITKQHYETQEPEQNICSASLYRGGSRMSVIDKPERRDEETSARYYWRIIRSCITTAIDHLNKVNARDIHLKHGIQHQRHLSHPHGVTDMLYNRHKQEYVTVDGSYVHVFDKCGRKVLSKKTEEQFTNLVYAAELELFVGWSKNKSNIYLMNSDFNINSSCQAIGDITAALYNSAIEEIVTIGCGFVTTWVFRYGGRHLLPRKTSRDGLDSKYVFNDIVLEETASRQQRLYAAHGTAITVINVYDGIVIGEHPDLHVREITALCYFNPLKYLITGSNDGSIKVWDDRWHIQIVFVGHNDSVSSLSLYPYGPYILSASHDNSLRVWSLETCDQVDRLDVEYPVNSLSTLFNMNDFFSFSGTSADLWTVNHIHSLHSTMSSKVIKLKCTDHPYYAMRCVSQCRDSSVRIISPTNGDVITSLITSSSNRIQDAAYSISEDLLFTVYDNGCLIKSSTKTNPCEILSTWYCDHPAKACNYLLIYEYIITPSIGSNSDDKWAGMSRAVVVKGLPEESSETETNLKVTKHNDINKILLLGGRKDGHICVFNKDTGETEFEIEAHGTKGVLNMSANSKNDCLVSAGLDNIIKVWRLYPYAQESLAPLMSFYCAHTPIYMIVMTSKLMVAFHEHISATYNVVMYNLKEKNRQDHGPHEDHMDSVTGLTSCAKMKVAASCSTDGTIKIWDDTNHLIKNMSLNVVPHCLAFCSPQGDLLVGIDKYVHFISYKTYMPRYYRQKMVAMQFRNFDLEHSLPYNEELVNSLSKEEQKRLKAARSSFKFTHFVDILTEEENDEIMKDKRERSKGFAALKAREEELADIRDGKYKVTKKIKPSKRMKQEAFDNYLKLFYDKARVGLPELDEYAEEKIIYPKKIIKDVYKEREFQEGFFPSKDEAEPVPTALIRPDCFIPNSVFAKLLWPKMAEEKKTLKPWKPPGLSIEQLKVLGEQNKKKKKEGGFRETVMIFDYADDEEPTAEEEDEKEPQSEFMQKMQEAIEKPPTPQSITEEITPEVLRKDTTLTDTSSIKTSASNIKKPSQLRPLKPSHKPVEKLPTRTSPIKTVSSPDMKAPSPPPAKKRPRRRIDTPPPETPPRPETPLPEFIAQFIGLEWFDKYFPNCNTNTMPKPWSVRNFVTMLIRVLKSADFAHKIDVVRALSYIHKNQGISNNTIISETLYGILRSNINPPLPGETNGQTFIISALQLLRLFENRDIDYYVELLTQFLDGNQTIRAQVVELLKSCGVKDRHNHVVKELDSWDIWSLPDGDRSLEIRKMSSDWLEKWLANYKRHLEIVLEKLKKGQSVKTHVPVSKKETGKSSILKKNGNSSNDTYKEVNQEPKQSTVRFEKNLDITSIENATYTEAINYFCEMETEKELDILRAGGVTTLSDKPIQVKNTVLVLPKVQNRTALVRLGESHTTQHLAKKELFSSKDFKMPPVTNRGFIPIMGDPSAFPSCINLPFKTIYMNPFPSSLDDVETQNTQPVLVTMKSSQKYFIPERSIVYNNSARFDC